MPTDHWRPVPPPPCEEPCCTGALTDPDAWPQPIVVRDQPDLRECGVTGCTYCRLVTTPAGGGDRLYGSRP